MTQYGGYDQAFSLEYPASKDSNNPNRKFNQKFYTITTTKKDASGKEYQITSIYQDPEWYEDFMPVGGHRFIGTVDSRYPNQFKSNEGGAVNADADGYYKLGTTSQVAYFSTPEGMKIIRSQSKHVQKQDLIEKYVKEEKISHKEASDKADKEIALQEGKEPTTVQQSISPNFSLTIDKQRETQRHEMAGRPGQALIYPQDHAQGDFDFIKIVPIEYIPMLEAGQTFNDARRALSVKQRYRQKERVVGSTMFLPMVPGISESNAVEWGGNELNPLQMAMGQVAANAITNVGEGKFGEAATGIVADTGAAAQNLMGESATMKTFLTAYFAGRAAMGANLTGRAGIVVNPNLEVLFTGPKLRTFSYNFKFTPRDDREAQTVKTIIKVFKKAMAPKRRASMVWLGVPAVFKIKYLMRGKVEHPFLNKIKPCAMTSFNVDYTPEGSYMTYGDGSMTSYAVNMNFAELEPIYNNDVHMDSDDMGY